MKRSPSAVLALGLMAAATATLPRPALSQGVFPPPPPTGSQGVFPAPPPPGQAGLSTGAAPIQGGFSPAPGMSSGMSSGMGAPPLNPGAEAQCAKFLPLRDDAQKKGMAIQEAGKRHVDRQEMCNVVTRFFAAETMVVKFIQDNQKTCGIPPEVVKTSVANHAKTGEFKERVCDAPKPKVPTLSEAIGTPTLDTSKNTKTGPGTFDTLTGNPLAR